MITGAERLARYVREERESRWRSREAFAEYAGVGVRTVDRMEKAVPHRYRPSTKILVEDAFGWTRGSIDRTLAGGRPTRVADADFERLREAWARMSMRDRRAILALADALRR